MRRRFYGIGIAFGYNAKLVAVYHIDSAFDRQNPLSRKNIIRLEFEPNVTATPLVENELFEEVGHSVSHDLNSLLKRGISAAQNGDRRRARVLLTEASQLDPRSEDTWMWLASISDYPEELLDFLNNVLDINPDNERAADWMAAKRSS